MTDPSAPIWLCPERLFDGKTLRAGMALGVEGGRTTVMREAASLPAAQRRAVKGTLAPGFIDLQVNGGGASAFWDGRDPAYLDYGCAPCPRSRH